MRQRVMIAVALASEPAVLLCDEPTTALDVTIQAQILDLLDDLREDSSSALVFVTHDLGVVREICEDIAVMYAGRIVETGADRPAAPAAASLHARSLRAVVDVDEQSEPPRPIPGTIPSPAGWPAAARFTRAAHWRPRSAAGSITTLRHDRRRERARALRAAPNAGFDRGAPGEATIASSTAPRTTTPRR